MRAVLFALLLSLGFSVSAQTQPPPPGQTAMQRVAEDFLKNLSTGLPGQVSVEIGKLPAPERYANCQQWQAFLPAGARAWGRVSVGLRCLVGGSFSFYVSARVRVDGTYLVAARPIAYGQTIAAGDIRQVQGELTAQAPDLILDEAEVVGQIARTMIPAERPLQRVLLRPTVVIQAGQTVKILAQGGNFSVSNEGLALSAAAAGQAIRVKLGNGTIVSGIAREKGFVEVRN